MGSCKRLVDNDKVFFFLNILFMYVVLAVCYAWYWVEMFKMYI